MSNRPLTQEQYERVRSEKNLEKFESNLDQASRSFHLTPRNVLNRVAEEYEERSRDYKQSLRGDAQEKFNTLVDEPNLGDGYAELPASQNLLRLEGELLEYKRRTAEVSADVTVFQEGEHANAFENLEPPQKSQILENKPYPISGKVNPVLLMTGAELTGLGLKQNASTINRRLAILECMAAEMSGDKLRALEKLSFELSQLDRTDQLMGMRPDGNGGHYTERMYLYLSTQMGKAGFSIALLQNQTKQEDGEEVTRFVASCGTYVKLSEQKSLDPSTTYHLVKEDALRRLVRLMASKFLEEASRGKEAGYHPTQEEYRDALTRMLEDGNKFRKPILAEKGHTIKLSACNPVVEQKVRDELRNSEWRVNGGWCVRLGHVTLALRPNYNSKEAAKRKLAWNQKSQLKQDSPAVASIREALRLALLNKSLGELYIVNEKSWPGLKNEIMNAVQLCIGLVPIAAVHYFKEPGIMTVTCQYWRGLKTFVVLDRLWEVFEKLLRDENVVIIMDDLDDARDPSHTLYEVLGLEGRESCGSILAACIETVETPIPREIWLDNAEAVWRLTRVNLDGNLESEKMEILELKNGRYSERNDGWDELLLHNRLTATQVAKIMAPSVYLYISSINYVLAKSQATPSLHREDNRLGLVKAAFDRTNGWQYASNRENRVSYDEMSRHADMHKGSAKLRFFIRVPTKDTSIDFQNQKKEAYASKQKLYKSTCLQERREDSKIERRAPLELPERERVWRPRMERMWTAPEERDNNEVRLRNRERERRQMETRFGPEVVKFGYGNKGKNIPGVRLVKERIGERSGSIKDRLGERPAPVMRRLGRMEGDQQLERELRLRGDRPNEFEVDEV